jgi:hypothetical protein
MTAPHQPGPRFRKARLPIPSIVYKIVVLRILALLLFWLWKMYMHLPPAQPFRYPAYFIPHPHASKTPHWVFIDMILFWQPNGMTSYGRRQWQTKIRSQTNFSSMYASQ